MKNIEKAKIILKQLDEDAFLVNWTIEEIYLKAIVKALKKIEEEEKNGN